MYSFSLPSRVRGTCRWRIHKVPSGERQAEEDGEFGIPWFSWKSHFLVSFPTQRKM